MSRDMNKVCRVNDYVFNHQNNRVYIIFNMVNNVFTCQDDVTKQEYRFDINSVTFSKINRD